MVTTSKVIDGRRLLFDLDEPDALVEAKLLCRPSKRNRSPYVADIWLESEQREAIAHVPNLDMGGKCVPNATVLVKPARDCRGHLVGPDAVNPKYGTPKCEFILQLLYLDEHPAYTPVWVGAHPSLGERIAEVWLRENRLPLPRIVAFRRQVTNPGGQLPHVRADFVVTHEDATERIVEVKTVVDTDYRHDAIPDNPKLSNVISSSTIPYERAALFPFGKGTQKGPDGEPVVSARAIKHVRELSGQTDLAVTILFVVVRPDATRFAPNPVCPSFGRYLKEAASRSHVQVLARSVQFERAQCWEGQSLST